MNRAAATRAANRVAGELEAIVRETYTVLGELPAEAFRGTVDVWHQLGGLAHALVGQLPGQRREVEAAIDFVSRNAGSSCPHRTAALNKLDHLAQAAGKVVELRLGGHKLVLDQRFKGSAGALGWLALSAHLRQP